jgi:hypothetical protein
MLQSKDLNSDISISKSKNPAERSAAKFQSDRRGSIFQSKKPHQDHLVGFLLYCSLLTYCY